MNRRLGQFSILVLAAGIAGGIFVSGCASKDVRQTTLATVNGEEIKGAELREFFGVPAGVFAVAGIPLEKKKEALDQLVATRLLVQDGRSRGIDNTPAFKEIVRRNDQLVWIKALLRKEIEAKLKVTDEEMKAEVAKVKKGKDGVSDADAAIRAVKSVYGNRVQKIQDDLVVAAKKGAAAAVDPQVTARIGKDASLPDTAVVASVGDEKIYYGDVKKILHGLVPAGSPQELPDLSKNPGLIKSVIDREVTMRSLAAYAKKQLGEGVEGYKAMRQDMERSVLRSMVADNVAAESVKISDQEVEAAYAAQAAVVARSGQKIPGAAVAMLKERIRSSLLNQRGKKAIDAYIAGLKKNAKIEVKDAILPKI